MAIFEVEISEYDLKNAGWIHEDELADEGWFKEEDLINKVYDYLFKNSTVINGTLKDILDIIGVETWRLQTE